MDPSDEFFRDSIIRASASTYSPEDLSKRGLVLTANYSNHKTRFVGDSLAPIYPEIVIWKPDYPGGNTGQVVAVEAIETIRSLANSVLNKWRILASLGVRFNLVIPNGVLPQVKPLLRNNDINLTNIHIQTYELDSQERYVFRNIEI